MSADRRAQLQQALGDAYALERELGGGGMSHVYLATEKALGRQVVVKLLPAEMSGQVLVERFKREIALSARASAGTWRSRNPARACQRERSGNAPGSRMDATLSASAGDRLTTVGITVGTPQYMAPEQATADTNIDHRVDIYALGVLGYEMLTGKPLFQATTAQGQLAAHVLEVPKDIRERRPEVPAQLAETLLKCVAKDPADRWQSADELLAQLDVIASTPSGGLTPTTTRPFKAAVKSADANSSDVKTAVPPTTSRRWIGIAAAVALLTAGGVAVWMRGGAGKSAAIERIAVMPIEDISGKDALFVDAMQDALTNALGKLGTVGVASRSAMMPYNATPKPTREIATELKLDAVLEVTVFRSGDVMRINMQLSDPATTRSLWSETYERDVKECWLRRVRSCVSPRLRSPKSCHPREPDATLCLRHCRHRRCGDVRAVCL